MSRHLYMVKYLLDHLLRRHLFGFGLVGHRHPVTQHVETDRADVFGNDVATTLDEGKRFRAKREVDRRARGGAAGLRAGPQEGV